MDDYYAAFALTEALDAEGVRRLARHSCLDIHRVQWLRCYLAIDGTRMLCWYRAPDAESVRFVLRQQGATNVSVLHAVSGNVPDRVPVEGTTQKLVLEFAAAAGDQLQPQEPTLGSFIETLENQGVTVLRVLEARSGDCQILLIDSHELACVSSLLRQSAQTPHATWLCRELVPETPGLFQSQVSTAAGGGSTHTAASDDRAPGASLLSTGGDPDVLDAIIIGAGISGICMLERLLRMGMTVRLYESGSDVGGVWYWNRYPGARVDSESYSYGFSFSDEIVKEWRWRELFASQPEVLRYLRFVVDRCSLRQHMSFNARVSAARYIPERAHWCVETDRGDRVAARYLIAAAGVLSAPQMPAYEGMHEFSGVSLHTARWPESGVDLSGKRVGVIGTGSTGVQLIQTIAEEVQHLTVFQRTPTYCIPQRNRPLSEEELHRIRNDWPEILAACRESYGGFIHTFDPRSGLAVSAETREAKFEDLWQKPGFAFWLGNFADLMMNAEVNSTASEFLRRKIRERVHDPAVAQKLCPDHPFGSKRVILEKGYYEVYNRANVKLVDLRDTPIERITPDGIATDRETHPLDVIAYATGFDAGTGSLIRIDIHGEGGQTLADKWRQGPRTYLGLLVSGFPNLFIVNGPHNAAAFCNAARCIEQNVDWIARCIDHMRSRGLTRVNPVDAAEDEWTDHVYDTVVGTVLKDMTDSWFFGANTPGKPNRITIYAGGARNYRMHCEDVASAGYPGLIMA